MDPTDPQHPDTGLAATRRSLRLQARARRAAIPPAVRAAAAAQVVEQLAGHPRLVAADGVLLTAALGDELDLDGLRSTLLRRGATCALPRVEGSDLVAVTVTPATHLEPGWRGVPEPSGPPADVAVGRWVAVVPGLVFDRDGGRLGYGGGHFDRFLAAHPTVVPIGACFRAQLVDRVPLEPHDVRMTEVVTET